MFVRDGDYVLFILKNDADVTNHFWLDKAGNFWCTVVDPDKNILHEYDVSDDAVREVFIMHGNVGVGRKYIWKFVQCCDELRPFLKI